MGNIQWNSSIEVGNFEIDAEHKLFVSIIQKIENEILKKGNKDYIISLVNELLKYTEFHFLSEENIMIREGYPQHLEHKKIHERLLIDLRDKIFTLKYEYIDFNELLQFLFHWFQGHTSIEDLKFAQFLNDKQN